MVVDEFFIPFVYCVPLVPVDLVPVDLVPVEEGILVGLPRACVGSGVILAGEERRVA